MSLSTLSYSPRKAFVLSVYPYIHICKPLGYKQTKTSKLPLYASSLALQTWRNWLTSIHHKMRLVMYTRCPQHYSTCLSMSQVWRYKHIQKQACMFLCNKLYTSNSFKPCMCEYLTALSLDTALDNHALELPSIHMQHLSHSCPNHTNFSVRFQPWTWWGLCWKIDVDPPLFTLLQLKMVTNDAKSGCYDQPLSHIDKWMSLGLTLSMQV